MERKYTIAEIKEYTILLMSGILGEGPERIIKDAEKLPEELQDSLMAALLSAKIMQAIM